MATVHRANDNNTNIDLRTVSGNDIHEEPTDIY